MKVMKFFYLLSVVLSGVLYGCIQQADTSNRSYFTFDLMDRKMAIPVQLNDSITVKLGFDTGFGSGYVDEVIDLDSTVLLFNPSLSRNRVLGNMFWGVAWGTDRVWATVYDSLQLKLKIGKTDMVYSKMRALPFKKYMNSDVDDGIFNIPKSDTTHVWELNFEHNYMEVHPADAYKFPDDCLLFPLDTSGYSPFYVTLPLKFRFPDNDTLTIYKKFLIDTGAAWDIVLQQDAPEQEYLHQREDAVWLDYMGRYIRYYTADAVLSGDLRLDSLRLYTFDYKNNVHHPYLIGLNFLKRFNCFFDMKNKRLGLQPLWNFYRLVNPLYTRFYYSTQKNQDGRFIVTYVADHRENYYKEAGLQVGDELVGMAGIPYGELTLETAVLLYKLDSLAMDIVRNGKPQTLYVKIDHNEPIGD